MERRCRFCWYSRKRHKGSFLRSAFLGAITLSYIYSYLYLEIKWSAVWQSVIVTQCWKKDFEKSTTNLKLSVMFFTSNSYCIHISYIHTYSTYTHPHKHAYTHIQSYIQYMYLQKHYGSGCPSTGWPWVSSTVTVRINSFKF